MKKIQHLLLLSEIAVAMMRSDPIGFCHKVLEKLQRKHLWNLTKTGKLLQSTTESSWRSYGEYTQFVETELRKTWLQRAFGPSHFGLKDEVWALTATISPSRSVLKKATSPRVLMYLTNSLPHTQSGYSIRSQQLLGSLQKAGVLVRPLTRFAYPLEIGELPSGKIEAVAGIRYARMLPNHYPLNAQKRAEKTIKLIVRHAEQHGLNVLHTTTNFYNAVVVSRAAEILGVPWVYEVRGEPENTYLSRFEPQDKIRAEKAERYILSRLQETRAMRAAAAVVTLSEVSKKELVSRGVPAKKIFVIPNSINPERIKLTPSAEARRLLGLAPNRLVGSISSIVGYEGFDVLIRSIPLLPVDVNVLLVGTGTELSRLKQLAKTLGVAKRINFVGQIPSNQIALWYQSLDVFVLPRLDTKVTRIVTPIKSMQAQALRIPVVASNLPAIIEVTGGFETYVEPGSVIELAKGINSVLTNGNPVDENAIAKWLELQTWGKSAEKLKAVYESLMPV